MKRGNVFFVGMLLIAFFSCKKKDSNVSSTGTLIVKIENQVNGQTIAMTGLNYTNAAGNQYSVSMLKYYLTNFVLTKSDGSTFAANNYTLIDASDANKKSFTIDNVPNGTYTSAKFFIGVDASRNHTGVQDGDLDPMYGMIWTWNTGYIFFKHEGLYKDTSGATQALVFHYGTDAALATAQTSISVDVEGNSKTIYLEFNLNNLYKSPNPINFNQYNYQQSSTAADSIWIVKLKANFANTFSFDRAE